MSENKKTIRNYWLWHYWHDDPDCRCPKCGDSELFTIRENNQHLENRVICLKCRWEGEREETGYSNHQIKMVKQRCPNCNHFEVRYSGSEYVAETWKCLKCGREGSATQRT